MKKCPHCEKVTNKFAKNRSKASGFQTYCTDCTKLFHSDPEEVARRKARLSTPQKRAYFAAHMRKSKRANGRFSYVSSIARTKGKEWSITREQYESLIIQVCSYCEGPLPETGVGLDRLDNSKGYVIDNVAPCCWQCNRARNDFFTVEEMKIYLGPAIKSVRKARNEISSP